MKTNRSFFTAIVLGLALFITPSCDSLLDEPQETLILEEGVDYTNTALVNELIEGAYHGLYDIQWETFPLISVRGDDVNAKGDQDSLWDTEDFNYDRSLWMYNSAWLNLYSDIINWYAAIEELERFKAAGANADEVDQYIAEIKVMQAFELLQLARVWGNILIPNSSQTTTLFETAITPFDNVMAHISDLMDEALPNLLDTAPHQRTYIRGGITRYTALAVKAMANLEIKEWQIVADATGEIISSNRFTLSPDYYTLFKTAGKLSSENILEFQFSDFGEGSGEDVNYLNQFFGPSNWTPVVNGVGTGWGFWEPSMKYITFMLDRGETVRLETSVLFTAEGIQNLEAEYDGTLPPFISNTTREGDILGATDGSANPRSIFLSGKHYLPTTEMIPGRTTYGSNKNFICIRYSEILLMHAEALVNGGTGGTISADEAVNAVRNRVGLSSISGVTIDDVLDEKFAEFGMEWGIRFYDLVRHNKTNELDGYSPDDRFLPYPLPQLDLLPQLNDG